MADWSRARSEERIGKFLETVPEAAVTVRNLDRDTLAGRLERVRALKAEGRQEQLIASVGRNEAVIVDGVHVYVQLVGYQDTLLERERDTERGHEHLLQMLHVHYATCDLIAEEFDAQRVDFHGPRMHAVIMTPADDEHERIVQAMKFADAITRAIGAIGARVANGKYRSGVRIGIDTGKAVAVNSGTSSEPEPLFLGSAANHAAKLAEGDQPGIFPSSRVRAILDLGAYALDAVNLEGIVSPIAGRSLKAEDMLIERAVLQIEERFQETSVPDFRFHFQAPPLRQIDFSALRPSNSIRMELATLFCDLSGFTAYVDACVAEGRVPELISNLHVLRAEFAAVLKADFGGKKVRFIGDCIHGVVAEGNSRETMNGDTVALAIKVVAGVRSSFELCRSKLSGLGELGLKIGVEFGAVPITRIGLRGERSVRCCAGRVVSEAERLQSECRQDDETRLGNRARNAVPVAYARIFNGYGSAFGLDYETLLTGISQPSFINSGSASSIALPHSRL